MAPSRSSRGVFGINALVSIALVVLVAAIALVVQPPSPPGIAAFAPQASKPITKAPPGQSSVSGTGSGACAAGQVCTSSPPPKATTPPSARPSATAVAAKDTVASELQCYSWPDGSVTQTFDPQSPPCVPSWPERAKGNGGVTSPGVDGTTIRVAVPVSPSMRTRLSALTPIVDFINTHFEMYGRKIVLVPFDQAASATTQFGDPTAQHAAAEQAASLKTFAAFDFLAVDANQPTLPEYVDTLARHKVVTVSGGKNSPFTDEATLRKHAPYEWSYHVPIRQLLQTMTSAVCSQLVGKVASHSGDYVTRQRTFGMLLPDEKTTGPVPGVDEMRAALQACSGHPVKLFRYSNDGASENAAITTLKNDHVTSVVHLPFLNDSSAVGSVLSGADNISYHPEWLWIGWSPWLSATIALNPTPNQTSHLFGVGAFNKLTPNNLAMWFQAYTQAGGGPIASNNAYQGAEALYRELLLLASGIQTAGPHLTPETFAAALHATDFPNPGAGRAPAYQGTVGFPGVAMMQDALAFWWDKNETTAHIYQDDNTMNAWTAFCFVKVGQRATSATWGHDDGYFSPICR